ncbi:hypothetical protein NE237_011282 [Protea cynaroides]|uniref:SLH domain-containing protein n=1 Tax=Protea cynaroides TaxID=273540 RepID=A0A9Q0JVN7_9MAGN|nr:hypothetical protein NE237_011282 [Protea cynaroides]
MASLTIPSSPNSFQLRLGFRCKKSSLTFPRTCFRTNLDRRIRSCSATGSAAKEGDGSDRKVSGNSWTNSDKSKDNFAGWFGADSGDSQRKGGYGGIIGAGLAGVLLAAGLTFASISLSKRSTSSSGMKPQMESPTMQQEVLLASGDQDDRVEVIRNENNSVVLDEESLDSDRGPESNTGIIKDSCSYPEITEATSESSIDDNINVGASLIENVDSASSGIDATTNASSQEDFQFRPAVDEISIPYSSNLSSPRMPDYNVVDGSSDASSFKESGGSPAAALPELAMELSVVNPINPSVSDADSTDLDSYYQEGITELKEIENSKVPLDVSGSGQHVPHEPVALVVTPKLDVISDSQVQSKDVMDTVTSLSIKEDLDLSKTLLVPNEGITSTLERNNLDEAGPSGKSSLSDLADPNANEPSTDDYNEIDRSKEFFGSPIPEGSFSSAGIPAPSLVSAALQVPPGKVLVPAAVDQVQGQAFSALQVLKVIEADVQPGDLCTRREYARWLVSASSALSRSTISKVYPAMYIENVTDLAFDDITPEDPDFPSIQGLAEAGLISSNLSRRDMLSSIDEEPKSFFFSPESPLSRQDLVSWKMALDKRQLPEVDRQILHQHSGFIDIDKINPDAWPALVADLSAGEHGIMALAFGYTRLFQPEKPVTKAQAAIALSIGEAADIVSEELTRIEAESMAETAVAAHSALVAEVEKDINATFEKELAMEKEKIDAVEKLAEEAKLELERLKAERKEENSALLRGRAAVEAEMEVLSQLRHEVEEQLQMLMSNKMEISFERERIEKLRKEAESENQAIARLQYELEVERKALSMARVWAEDEAKRAREQAKALEEARERWERHGIKVVVDSDLQDDANAGVTWLEAGKQSADETVNRAEKLVGKLKAMAHDLKGNGKVVIENIIQKIISLIAVLKEWATEAARRTGEIRKAAVLKVSDSIQKLEQNTGEIQRAAILKVSDSIQKLEQNTAGFSSSFQDGAKRIAGDCREGVEKLTQKFKT